MITNYSTRVNSSQISLSICKTEKGVDTIGEWVIEDGRDGMESAQFTLFSDIILYPMLFSKSVIVDQSLREDPRVETITQYLNTVEYQSISELELNGAEYESFMLLGEGNICTSLYLITDELVQEQNVSYIAAGENNSIGIIPAKSSKFSYADVSGQNTLKSKVVSGNLIFLVILLLVGFCIMMLFRNKVKLSLRIALSIPLGALAEIAVVFLYGILGIPITEISLYGCLAVIAFAGLWFKGGKPSDDQFENKIVVIVTVMVVAFSLIFFSAFPHYYLGFDSVENIFWGQYIALHNGFGPHFGVITSYSLLLSLVFGGAGVLGIGFLYSFVPVITVSLMLVMLLGMCEAIRCPLGVNIFFRSALIGIPVLFMALTPMFILDVVWVMNNQMIGLFLGVAILLNILSEKLGECAFAYIGLGFFLLSSCARVEGPIFGILIVCFLTQYLTEHKTVKLYSVSLMLLTLVLFGKQLLSNYNFSSDFWSVDKGIMVVVVVFVGMIYVMLQEKLEDGICKWALLYRKLPQLAACGLLAAGMILAIMRPKKFLVNTVAYTSVLLGSGNYGAFWLICGLLIGYVYILRPSKKVLSLGSMTLCYLLLIFDLMMLRTQNLRAGYGDSASRMALHIMPTAMLFIIEFLISLNNKEEKNAKG